MEPKKPQRPGEATPEKPEIVQQELGAQGDESAAESFDQTNLERPAEFGLILPNNPGPIARALRDDPELSRAESPGEPTVPRSEVADPTELAATSDPLIEVGLSPAEMEKLVQQVIDAPTQQMSAGAESPDQLAGYIFRPIEGEGSESSNAESASTRPRVDDRTPHVDRSSGEVPRNTEQGERHVAPPRVVVMVQLADAQALMEKDRIALASEMAAMVEEIADARIERAQWRQENQRRAADYRLRR